MANPNSMPRVFAFLSFLFLVPITSSCQLRNDYYYSSCFQVSEIVKSIVDSEIAYDARMGASLLRLFFHDCFVDGCDGSVLLDNKPRFIGEKTAKANNHSLRGFEVIDKIKQAVEAACPRVVSCADILAIAARDSVAALGGPYWEVKLGRRDSRKANITKAKTDLPTPNSNFTTIASKFYAQGLSLKDLVALSGAHTIGKARCVNFRSHIYKDSDLDSSFAKFLRSQCPPKNGTGDDNLVPLDFVTENAFDNAYFHSLLQKKGVLHSDQVLLSEDKTRSLVLHYSTSPNDFFADFVAAMNKMADIRPLTGSKGEIRKNCRRIN